MKKSLGILLGVTWLVFAGQATAQDNYTQGHLMTNVPRFCSYGYNPNCQSWAIDVWEDSERFLLRPSASALLLASRDRLH